VSIAEAIEAERYWTTGQYALALGKSARWVEDQCVRYDPARLFFARVGRDIRFSPEDRARNRALFAEGPFDDEPQAPASGFQIPNDPAELARLLADVRRVSPAAQAA